MTRRDPALSNTADAGNAQRKLQALWMIAALRRCTCARPATSLQPHYERLLRARRD